MRRSIRQHGPQKGCCRTGFSARRLTARRMRADDLRRGLDALSEREGEAEQHRGRAGDHQQPHEAPLARRPRLASVRFNHAHSPPGAGARLSEKNGGDQGDLLGVNAAMFYADVSRNGGSEQTARTISACRLQPSLNAICLI